jgi:hypothetical protein
VAALAQLSQTTLPRSGPGADESSGPRALIQGHRSPMGGRRYLPFLPFLRFLPFLSFLSFFLPANLVS